MRKTLWFSFLAVGAGVMLTIGVPTNSSRAADDATLTIAYSGNMMGYMEPCG